MNKGRTTSQGAVKGNATIKAVYRVNTADTFRSTSATSSKSVRDSGVRGCPAPPREGVKK